MIKIKYIPNIFSPHKRLNKELSFLKTKTISDYLIESGYEYKDKTIIVSGKRNSDLNSVLKDKEEILILPEIKDPGTLAVLWAIVQIIYYTAVVASMVYGIYLAFTPQRKQSSPNFGSADSEDSSPTYGWDGVQTTQDVNIPVPIVYGEHKVGGNIINSYIHTDGDKSFLNVLIGISEGQIESLSSVKINDQSVSNYSGVTCSSTVGSNGQGVISNFQDLHNVYSVSSAMVQNTSINYTTVNTDVEAFELTFLFSNGIYEQNSSDGSLLTWDVDYTVGYRVSSVGTYIDLGTTTISAKSRSAVRRIFRKDGLAATQYDIQVTRTSDNTSTYKMGDMLLSSVDEIQTDDLAYPNTALLGIEAMATDQLSGNMPNFTSIVKGIKVSVPAVLQGTASIDWEDYYWDTTGTQYKLFADNSACTWDGTTYVTAYSANPVWCLRDLLTNTRYGLGEYVTTSMIDQSQLVTLSRHCDERIGDGEGLYEKRFRLDMVIDQNYAVPDLLMQIAGVCRGLFFYSEGTFKATINRDEDAVQLFGMGNMISFNQSWKSIREVPNVIDVQFLDKDKDYKQETISYIDETALAGGDPIRKKAIRLYTTGLSYAIREARYQLKLAQYIDQSISFKAGIDAVACQPGDRIDVSHDVPQWGWSGRVVSGTNSAVTVDQVLTVDGAKSYQIKIRYSDDTIDTRSISNVAGTYSIITVGTAFSQVPAGYDVYAFGETNIVANQFRVMSMRINNNNEIEIDAVKHDVNVFDDSDVTLPSNNYSALVLDTPDAEDLQLTEEIVKLGDGKIEDAINVWFNKPSLSNFVKTYDRAKIYLSDNAGTSWDYRGETRGQSFQIIGNLRSPQSYSVAVVSVSAMNEENSISGSPTSVIALVGKSAYPSNVSNFIVMQFRDRVSFSWSHISDVDLAGYEIRYGDTWDAGTVVATKIKQNSLIHLNLRVGIDQSYWIKAIDTSGNYSETETEGQITIDSIPFTNIINTFNEEPTWTGVKTNCIVVGSYLQIGTTYLTGDYETTSKDLSYLATFRIGIEDVLTLAGSQEFDDDITEEFDDSTSKRFTGSAVSNAAAYDIKVSTDGSVWSSYTDYQSGDYYCRYYQLKQTLTRGSLAQTLQCEQLMHYADLPDIDEFGVGAASIASSGVTISFTKTFHEEPAVHVEIAAGDGVYSKFTTKDTTGFTAVLYSSGNAAVTGSIDYHAHGV